ncbi:aldolase [Nostoc sp. 3335mG]|nr:aldolase [Nostoc sp. 3335mG]
MGLKQRLAAGERLWGSFLKTPSPILVEVLASAGLDLLCLDAEHAPFDRGDLDICIMAARANGLPVVVRTQSANAEQMLNCLDCGADGILVPHVRSADHARAVVTSAHYGVGGRGYAGSSRAAGYGTTPMDRHKATSANRTTVILQIEDLEPLQELDEIAAVDGVDALFVGRIDLTVALGADSPDDPAVIAAVDAVISAGRRHHVPVGMFVPRDADVASWAAKGASLFLQGSDHNFMRAGARAARAAAGLDKPIEA